MSQNNKITVVRTGNFGPKIQRDVTHEELSELDPKQWEPVGKHGEYTVEELSAASIDEIQDSPEEIEGKEIAVELSSGRTRHVDPEQEELAEIDPFNLTDTQEKFLSDSEIEELQKAEKRENPERETTIEEVWDGIRKDSEKVQQQINRKRKERAIQRTIENHDWLKEPKYSKKVSELSGESFVELLQEGLDGDAPNSAEEALREELQEALEPFAEEQEQEAPVPLDAEVAEMAAESWSEYGGIWAEFAEDIQENSVEVVDFYTPSGYPDSSIEELSNGAYQLHTENDEAKEEAHELAEETDSVRILSEKNGVLSVYIADKSAISHLG